MLEPFGLRDFNHVKPASTMLSDLFLIRAKRGLRETEVQLRPVPFTAGRLSTLEVSEADD
jgi:hypothetical protein